MVLLGSGCQFHTERDHNDRLLHHPSAASLLVFRVSVTDELGEGADFEGRHKYQTFKERWVLVENQSCVPSKLSLNTIN